MLYSANWKVLLICAVCLLGVVLSLPNLFPAALLAQLPDAVPHQQVSLGLDLRGGSYLLLRVDFQQEEAERLQGLVDNVREALRKANIGYTGLGVHGNAITFTIRDLGRIDDAKTAIAKIDPDLGVTIGT